MLCLSLLTKLLFICIFPAIGLRFVSVPRYDFLIWTEKQKANWIGKKYFLLNKAFLSEISFWYVYLAPCLITRYLLPTEDTGFSSNLPDIWSNGLMCFCFSTWEGTFQNQQKVSRCPISPSELGAWGKKRILFSPSFPSIQYREQRTEQAAHGAVISLQLSEGTHVPAFLAVH